MSIIIITYANSQNQVLTSEIYRSYSIVSPSSQKIVFSYYGHSSFSPPILIYWLQIFHLTARFLFFKKKHNLKSPLAYVCLPGKGVLLICKCMSWISNATQSSPPSPTRHPRRRSACRVQYSAVQKADVRPIAPLYHWAGKVVASL